MYNLSYTPTTLGVQSWREIISGGTRTKKVEYHWSRHYRGWVVRTSVSWSGSPGFAFYSEIGCHHRFFMVFSVPTGKVGDSILKRSLLFLYDYIFKAVNIHIVIWVMTPCSLLVICHGIWYLNPEDPYMNNTVFSYHSWSSIFSATYSMQLKVCKITHISTIYQYVIRFIFLKFSKRSPKFKP
jgi:hypothetical protein